MLAYFRLLRFTQNSASESFGLHLAEIYVANPTLVEDAFRQLTPEQKCTAFAELSWGFGNVTYGKTPSAATKRLEQRLTRMKPILQMSQSPNQAMQRTAPRPDA
jgi:hypothetical protein